jgi:hypothetical protein
MIMFGIRVDGSFLTFSGVGQFLIPLAAGILVLRRQPKPIEHTTVA